MNLYVCFQVFFGCFEFNLSVKTWILMNSIWVFDFVYVWCFLLCGSSFDFTVWVERCGLFTSDWVLKNSQTPPPTPNPTPKVLKEAEEKLSWNEMSGFNLCDGFFWVLLCLRWILTILVDAQIRGFMYITWSVYLGIYGCLYVNHFILQFNLLYLKCSLFA